MLPRPLQFSLLFHGSHRSFRSPLPNSVLELAGVQVAVAQAVAQGASGRCCCCFLPGSCFEHLMLMAREAAPLRPRGDVPCAEAHNPPVPWRPERSDRVLAPVVRDHRWLSPRLLPCENETVLNDPPLVYDLLLRWRIQGNCLCIQIAQSQFRVTAFVALLELQAPMVALYRHRLPVHSVLIRRRVLRSASCQSIVRPLAVV